MAGAGAEQPGGQRSVSGVGEHRAPPRQQRVELVRQRAGRAHLAKARNVLPDLFDRVREQVLLRLPALVDGHLRDPGALGDAFHARLVDAALDEQVDSRFQDRGVGVGIAGASWSRAARCLSGHVSILACSTSVNHRRNPSGSSPRHARCPSGRTSSGDRRASASNRTVTSCPRCARAVPRARRRRHRLARRSPTLAAVRRAVVSGGRRRGCLPGPGRDRPRHLGRRAGRAGSSPTAGTRCVSLDVAPPVELRSGTKIRSRTNRATAPSPTRILVFAVVPRSTSVASGRRSAA